MLADMPEPTTDPEPPRAPGGVDATMNEADPGSTVATHVAPEPTIPDPPFSAQKEEDKIPDEIHERDEETDDVPADVEEAKDESTSEEPPA